MNFKEQLRELADKACNNLDISKEIEAIKCKMTKFYNSGIFIIEVIDPGSAKRFAIGPNYGCPKYITFVPKNTNPAHYRDLFVKELKKLGFTKEDIVINERVYRDCTSYKIILTW